MAKKLTQKQIKVEASIVSDPKKSLKRRREAHENVMRTVLNPKSKRAFNPETFDPFDDDPDFEVKKRIRVVPSRRLPTLGMKPKTLLEGQMVGMYESKQDLYLLIAWLSGRVSDLEEALEEKGGKS